MNIKGIVRKVGSKTICHDTTYSSFEEVRNSTGDQRVTLVVEDLRSPHSIYGVELTPEGEWIGDRKITPEEIDKSLRTGTYLRHLVDMGKLLKSDESAFWCKSWEELEAVLVNTNMKYFSSIRPIPDTIHYVEGDRIMERPNPIRTRHMVGAKIVQNGHTTDITESYCDHRNPTMRNIKNLRWLMDDIVISHNNPVPEIDFNNVLPIIRGKAIKPIVYEDEIFLLNCTKLLQTGEVNAPNNMLIDFTPLGGIDYIKFSDCARKDDTNNGFYLVIPEEYSLDTHTPIFVMGGKLFTTDDIVYLDRRTFVVEPDKLDFVGIEHHNRWVANEYEDVAPTNIPELREAFIENMFDPDNNESFIVMVKNPNMYVHKTGHHSVDIGSSIINFPKGCGGLLMRQSTRELLEFFVQGDSTFDYYHVPNLPGTRRLLRETDENIEVNFEYCVYKGFDKYVQDGDDKFTLINFLVPK